MQPYQQRVVAEKADLDGKISRLADFIGSDRFVKVDEEERDRMREQLRVMLLYSEILGERIAAYGLREAT